MDSGLPGTSSLLGGEKPLLLSRPPSTQLLYVTFFAFLYIGINIILKHDFCFILYVVYVIKLGLHILPVFYVGSVLAVIP